MMLGGRAARGAATAAAPAIRSQSRLDTEPVCSLVPPLALMDSSLRRMRANVRDAVAAYYSDRQAPERVRLGGA
jgi:hypothetical protein